MSDRFRLPFRKPVVVQNVHYEEDTSYTMQYCRWVLKPIGIWYLIYGHSSRGEKLISVALILTCFSFMCFVLIPSGLHTVLREKDINIRIKLFGPVGFVLTSMIKYCYLGLQCAAFGRCIEHVENDWRVVRDQDHRRIMRKNAQLGRRLTVICVLFLYTGGLSYHTIMPLSSKQIINETITIRRLTYPGYDMFFDPTASPAYEIVFCAHCASALITYNITTSAYSLAAIFVCHACGQLKILMTLIDDLIKGTGNGNTTVETRLRIIAKHHVRVLRFSANVDEVLREVFLMEVVASTLTMCLLEYYLMTEWENSNAVAILTYFILLISFIFNVFIFCYIGELLAEQYNKISSVVYNIKWYNLSGNKALALILIITMSHYPPKLTAGKFIDLSVYTFGILLKTSVIYLNLLRTVT